MKKRVVYGTPLTPAHLINELAGSSFCVSYWNRKKLGKQLDNIIDIVGEDEILLVDNGAFSAWMSGQQMDDEYWEGFAAWASDILERCPQAVAVIPDVIDGDAAQNDELMHDFMCMDWLDNVGSLPTERLMPVWHMHEPLSRLQYLVESGFAYIAFGSSGEYATPGTAHWDARIQAAFAAIDELVDTGAYARPWIHMMRAQAQAHKYDFDSSDSTNVAVNHCRYKAEGEGHVKRMAQRVAGKIVASCDMVERAEIETPAQITEGVARQRWLYKLYDLGIDGRLAAQ
jgi:hypothetical protein